MNGVANQIDPIIEKNKRKTENKLNAESTFEIIANEWLAHNYEGLGWDASDNNSIYALLWLMF